MNWWHHKALSIYFFPFHFFYFCCVLYFMAIPIPVTLFATKKNSCLLSFEPFMYLWIMFLINTYKKCIYILIMLQSSSETWKCLYLTLKCLKTSLLLSRFNIIWEKSEVSWLLRYCPKAVHSGCSLLWCWWSMKFKSLQKFTLSIKLLSKNRIWRMPGG